MLSLTLPRCAGTVAILAWRLTRVVGWRLVVWPVDQRRDCAHDSRNWASKEE